MTNESLPDDLDSRLVDYSTALVRGAAGLIPLVGPLLAEVIGVKIPGQHADRIAKFARVLDHRLKAVEKSLLEQKLKNADFTDLIEEGFRQAARSLSDERRSYIVNLIASGLASDDIDNSESKHLLRILGEINDIEVVWLRFYRERSFGGDEAFRKTHEEVLKPVAATYVDSQEVLNKATLQKSYKEHLARLGLLESRYRTDSRTGLPEFDRASGSMKESGYGLSALGRLLLDEVGLGEDDSDP